MRTLLLRSLFARPVTIAAPTPEQAMLDELVAMLKARGFHEGKSHEQGHYTIERAFVEKD